MANPSDLEPFLMNQACGTELVNVEYLDFRIIAQRPYTVAPNEFIVVVLAQHQVAKEKYVTWCYNLKDRPMGSFFGGHYFDFRGDLEDLGAVCRHRRAALEDFCTRGLLTVKGSI